ncbi:MAG: LytR/AlgR family response regulator transcription factor [Blautia sp.]
MKLRKDKYAGEIAFISQDASLVFKGYEVDACQYFLKPADQQQLHRLFFRLSMKSIQQQSSQFLLLNYGTNYNKIRYSDILYIETFGRKVAIHTLTKDPVIYYPCKLSELEDLLPTTLFVRCHQSFILSINTVKSISKATAFLIDGTEIPISRSYKEIVYQFFGSK